MIIFHRFTLGMTTVSLLRLSTALFPWTQLLFMFLISLSYLVSNLLISHAGLPDVFYRNLTAALSLPLFIIFRHSLPDGSLPGL